MDSLDERLEAHKDWAMLGDDGQLVEHGVGLRSSTFREDGLCGVYLGCADLRYADLSFLRFAGATLWAADLRGADLSYAELRSTDLSDADLTGANLTGADLTDANLASTVLRNVCLTRGALDWHGLGGAGQSRHRLMTPLVRVKAVDLAGAVGSLPVAFGCVS